jgi:hypothetical protein
LIRILQKLWNFRIQIRIRLHITGTVSWIMNDRNKVSILEQYYGTMVLFLFGKCRYSYVLLNNNSQYLDPYPNPHINL